MARIVTGLIVATMAIAVALIAGPVGSAAPDGLRQCAVSDGRTPETATPEEVGVDSAGLRRAVDFASDPTRFTVQVYRNNCLIGGGPNNQHMGGVAWNLWSGTKSVVSMVAGVAVDEHKLRVDDPIGNYLPAGLGDDEHRAITVRSLLTETSGMEIAIASEGVTGLVRLDPNVVAQALAMPILHPQGQTWQYSQRAVDLLVYVIQQAVGEDFQAYAQRKLFDPLGIRTTDYLWARDRSGNTYGHAHLVLPPDDYVKLGLLLVNRGNWQGRRLISTDYLTEATTPAGVNPCYGFLITVNGPDCEDLFPGLPKDAIEMSGMLRQDNYIVPSLGLLVSWTGVTVPGGAVSFPHDFLRALTGAFRDPALPDPGPYVERPDTDLTDPMFVNPDATLAALGLGPMAYPGCGLAQCLGKPLYPPFGSWPPGCFILGCAGADPATPGIR
ncbi:class C beta-lactamase-related serine hydrolase [Nocardia yunnanensis]|uniref:Class C beta-lactamase-related serine hydrolase n=1 Tax=Nocardia yunnanensis TaxID=2382165 RepID=A0A386ZGX9_9NOCA|nr:serine hydrolase [Nocardia yunnanensis]AYF76374.1 class C beta-lactamase-related serine hydrolase [Nocardia yunnanensis]